MTARKDEDAVRDAVMVAPTPAAAARALGVPGKSFRDTLRGRFGVYVSHTPDAWNDTLRAAAFAWYATSDPAERRGIVAAYKDVTTPDAPDA